MRITSMFTPCSSYIYSLDPSVQYCTVRLQVRLSVHCTKSHLQKPILSLFRIHNVISVHCELRKRADRQIFEKHTAKQTQHAMFLAKKKKRRRKSASETKINFNVMPRETVKYFHIFLHYSTVLKGSGSQFFQDFSRRSDIVSGSHLCFFFVTHKNRCEFRTTTGK